jgi:hypothetical protein
MVNMRELLHHPTAQKKLKAQSATISRTTAVATCTKAFEKWRGCVE